MKFEETKSLLGKFSPLDIWSVVQGDKRHFSMLSFTAGLIAEIDKDSEKYRYMGGFRFTWTAISKILGETKPYPFKILYIPSDEFEKQICTVSKCKICEKPSKEKIFQISISTERLKIKPENEQSTQKEEEEEETEDGPPLQYISDISRYTDKLVTLETEFSYFILTNISRLSLDTIPAPYAHLSDGQMDLIYMKKRASKFQLVQLLLGLEKGNYINLPNVEYHKTKFFVIEPLENRGYFMVDGEKVALEKTLIECHRGLLQIFT